MKLITACILHLYAAIMTHKAGTSSQQKTTAAMSRKKRSKNEESLSVPIKPEIERRKDAAAEEAERREKEAATAARKAERAEQKRGEQRRL